MYMPLINQPIEQRAWKTVRDRIASIISIEMFNQAAIQYDDRFDVSVYTERSAPVLIEECRDSPVIVVSIDSISPEGYTQITRDDMTLFNIAIYSSQPANSSGSADIVSMDFNQSIAGMIDAIFSHPGYCRLGFPPPFIMRSEITSIKFGVPDRQESAGISLSLITLSVRHGQKEPEDTGFPFGLNTTQVKVNETEKGFLYQTQAI